MGINPPLTPTVRSTRPKINKALVALYNKTDQLYLINIYRTLHPKKAKYTFLSSVHGMFSRIGHKTSLKKFKRIEIISSFFPTITLCNWKLIIGRKNMKSTNTWTQNYATKKKRRVMKKSKRKSEDTLRQMKMEKEKKNSKIYRIQQSQFEKFITIQAFFKKQRTTSNE